MEQIDRDLKYLRILNTLPTLPRQSVNKFLPVMQYVDNYYKDKVEWEACYYEFMQRFCVIGKFRGSLNDFLVIKAGLEIVGEYKFFSDTEFDKNPKQYIALALDKPNYEDLIVYLGCKGIGKHLRE